MGNLYITEFTNTGADSTGRQVQAAAQPPVAEQKVTTSGTSAQSSAFNTATTLVRLHTDTDIYVLFGTDPTSTTSKMKMVAGQTEYFTVPRGVTLKVAAIV